MCAPTAVIAPAATNAAITMTPTTIIPLPPVTGAMGIGVAVGSGELVTVQKTKGVAVGMGVAVAVGAGVWVAFGRKMISVSPG